MANPELQMTLDDCVDEVLGILTGLELRYQPEQDRYRAVTRAINRALRLNALEQEWGYYADDEEVGVASEGERELYLRSTIRPRMTGDDAVRLKLDGRPVVWAYFLPRDALHKYDGRGGLRCSVTRGILRFSRPFTAAEDGMTIEMPVMREPRMFRLPEQPDDPDAELITVPDAIRNQLLDFDYPDVVLMRAAHLYAQTDPVMQPRVQTLEAMFKDLMYQIMERDERNTDTPYINEWFLPVENSINGPDLTYHRHPHADERRTY